MTNVGGQYGFGVIFTTDSAGGNATVRYNFSLGDGANPLFTNLIQARDGMLYGVAYKGGKHNFGVLFQFDPFNLSFTKRVDFDSINGSKPLGSLLQAGNGLIYGLAYKGGKNDKGVLFQYDPLTSVYTKKFDFSTSDGCYPHGALIQAKDGLLYGLAVQGGATNSGVLFQYDPVHSTYTKKIDFDSIHGRFPLGTLLQLGNGDVYGYTTQGGIKDKGVLFQYNTMTNTCTNKVEFTGDNGDTPLGFLIQASDSMLYGMTNTGGMNNTGVLFRYDPATSAYTKEFDFDSIQGSYPYGSLLKGPNGFIYGLTSLGGTTHHGVLFEYDIAKSSYHKKMDFDGASGELPYGSLIAVDLKNTGISSEKKPGLQLVVYPNPNNGVFTVQSAVEGTFEIVDVLGNAIQSFKLSAANSYTACIENLKSGWYVIVSSSRNNRCRKKIFVEK